MEKKDKWIGKNQRCILSVLDHPCTKLELLDLTGLNNSVVTNALYALERRGFIVKVGKIYSATNV